MDELIAELERATEGSRELDGLIWKTLEPPSYQEAKSMLAGALPKDCPKEERENILQERLNSNARHYTTSLDAALTLVPEGWAGGGRIVAPCGPYQIEFLGVKNDRGMANGEGETPALALCIAALKARMKEQDHD